MPGAAPLILIADDDDDSRYVFSRLLTHRGFRVAEATDGVQAVEMAVALAPALILMDYLLPGMTGWDAARRIRANPGTAGIVIINMTAYSYEGIADDARAAGCNAFIEKPCDPFEVVAMVISLVGAANDDAVPARTLRLDASSDAALA